MLFNEIIQLFYYILRLEKLCRKLIKTKFEHKWTKNVIQDFQLRKNKNIDRKK